MTFCLHVYVNLEKKKITRNYTSSNMSKRYLNFCSDTNIEKIQKERKKRKENIFRKILNNI